MGSRKSFAGICRGLAFAFFFFQFQHLSAQSSIRSNAQTDSVPPYDHRLWGSIGPVISSGFPNLNFQDSHSLYGGEAGLTYEKRNQVIYLKAYGIVDVYKLSFGNYNPIPNKLSSLFDVSLSYGHRFPFKWGSLIPSVGLSIGHLDYRGDRSDTTWVPGLLGWGSDPVYNFYHHTFVYLGVPITVRWVSSRKYIGFELGAYCNLHQYADIGFTAAIAIGRITDYRKYRRTKK
jgi:hypothetical protein